MKRTEHYIAAQDGIKTYVLEITPAGELKEPPIFCIHGLTRNHKDFEPIFDELAKFGRKIYAIDVRGRGNSDYDPKPENYNPATYMGDVANIMAQLNIPKAVFIGTSMGGLISMLMAAFMPDKVAAIILNDVGPEVNEEGIARIRQYVGNTSEVDNWDEMIARVKSIAVSAYPLRADDDGFWIEFTKRIAREENGKIRLNYDPNIKIVVQAVKEGEPTPNLWPQFAMIKDIPMGAIRGALSDILTHEILEKMKEAQPNLEIAEVENIGHAPILNEAAALALIGAVISKV